MRPVSEFYLADEAATLALGMALGQQSGGRGMLYLCGDLGAGKTTLTRGVLRALGHPGAVKSPTFTLVEQYSLAAGEVWHFDLYRLADPEELEYMGIRDYFDGNALCIVEWPEQGRGVLPGPDVQLNVTVDGEGRRAILQAGSNKGRQWLADLAIQQGDKGTICV